METLSKEFVPYKEALALKELGFDEPCVYYVDEKDNGYIYNFKSHPNEFIKNCCNLDINVIKTPLYQQAFKWFREKYNYAGFIQLVDPEYGGDYGYTIYYNLNYLAVDHWNKGFKTYEEAELACLDKLIEICKEKKS